jgi:hypothetical protein
MAKPDELALEALRRVRRKSGLLPAGEARALERDLARIEQVLCESPADPYALALDVPDPTSDPRQQPQQRGAAPAPTPAQPAAAVTQQIGDRAAAALQAVNFPGFVAALVTGTFQAIVDATAQQVREYANLVASVSKSVDDFSRDNVTPNQVRDWLAARHPADVAVVLPEPGKPGDPRLVPRPGRAAESPPWLADYGLRGQELTDELTEGPLIERGRTACGEERLQTLATMVLLGINRVVVNEGDIRAKMQFHAVARDQLNAEMATAQMGQASIAGRSQQPQATTMISTLKANAQSDASIKTDLMGEVRITFRSETFPLERFADSQAIQLLDRHARWKGSEPAAAPAAPPPQPAEHK